VREQRFDQRRLSRVMRSDDGDIPKARDVIHRQFPHGREKVRGASPGVGRFLRVGWSEGEYDRASN
jgi:hypothetical protein